MVEVTIIYMIQGIINMRDTRVSKSCFHAYMMKHDLGTRKNSS